MTGILLMCFGSREYGKWAYNMAHSLKHYSEFPVHLISDSDSIDGLDISVFDSNEIVDFETDDFGRIDIALAKIKIFERSPFEKTLYLDVDGVVIKPIDELIKSLEGQSIYTQFMGKGKREDKISYTWADNDVVWEWFGLNEDSVLPTTQTSIIYFERTSKKFFEKLEENYNNKLPNKSYREMWGKSGRHPDELYYSVTLAQLGIIPDEMEPIFFPQRIKPISEIFDCHYVLSMYGGNNVKPYAMTLYDRVMQKIMSVKGKNHLYKAHKLYPKKMINLK
jgi:hypothetical protein